MPPITDQETIVKTFTDDNGHQRRVLVAFRSKGGCTSWLSAHCACHDELQPGERVVRHLCSDSTLADRTDTIVHRVTMGLCLVAMTLVAVLSGPVVAAAVDPGAVDVDRSEIVDGP